MTTNKLEKLLHRWLIQVKTEMPRVSRDAPFPIPGTTNSPVDVTRQFFTSCLDNSTNCSPVLKTTLRYLSLTSCLASLTLDRHHGWLQILPALQNSRPIRIYTQTYRSLFLYDPVAHLTLFRLLHFGWTFAMIVIQLANLDTGHFTV
jgi:hypothetical protein